MLFCQPINKSYISQQMDKFYSWRPVIFHWADGSTTSVTFCLGRQCCSSGFYLFVWLWKPIRECQHLSHLVHAKLLSNWWYCFCSFYLVLFWVVTAVHHRLSNSAPCLMAGRSSTMLSHESMSTWQLYLSLLQTSLKCSFGRPSTQEPSCQRSIWLYKMCLGMRPTYILLMWSSHLRRLVQSMLCMDFMLVHARTSVLLILSCHAIWRIDSPRPA
jgi:hypothetical protein